VTRGNSAGPPTRRLARLLVLGAVLVGMAGAAEARAAREAPARVNLECTNLRRLSDNFVLDLKLRFSFSRRERRYVRFENAGRGWQLVGQRPYAEVTPTRIVMADDAALTAYVERLTGDYYQIDHTATGLSVWGRCVPVGGMWRAL
jgi:hypothetical protein